MIPWLAVVGIGEDGTEALSGAARALIEGAELLVGGERHLALVGAGRGERLVWPSPLTEALPILAQRRGRRVCVLASGDPMCYGVGVLLSRHFAAEEMLVIPSLSVFSLAAARLVWPLADCALLSLHGRQIDRLKLHLYPGARVIALTSDGAAPAAIAALLCAAGWGPSAFTVFEHLGGPREKRVDRLAQSWGGASVADLNTVAIECRPGPEARALSRLAGLPDECFLHDGQITKREMRAVTLASLAPLPGELLWDVGAGCGSISIEWLRAGKGTRALAVERDPARAALVAQNAARLGVPKIEIVAGTAPAALEGLASPDAVFLGGSVSDQALFQALWRVLRPGGRLVANAVTLEGEAALAQWQGGLGGELIRLSLARAEAMGSLRSWRPALSVTQLAVTKAAASS